MLKRFKDRKECTKCHAIKPYGEFYRTPRKKDGYTYWCKECARGDHHKIYERDGEKIRERRKQEYRDGKKKFDPYKNAARSILRYEVKMGRINAEPCEVCGYEVTDGHHYDYSKPLDVKWLCRQHHMVLHRKENEQVIENTKGFGKRRNNAEQKEAGRQNLINWHKKQALLKL